MLISVVMATYNGAKYIEQQLESIKSQTRPPDELIICDDGSTDSTIDIIRNFKPLFPVRLYQNKSNLGVTKNFEKALKMAIGDLIATSDQDDIWQNNKLEILASTLQNNPDYLLAFCDSQIVDEHLNSLGYTHWQFLKFKSKEQQAFLRGDALKCLLRRNVVSGNSMMFKRKALDHIMPIPSEWMYDYWIAVIIAAIGRIYPLNQPLVLYRQHQGNQIGIKKEGLFQLTQTGKNLYMEQANRFQMVLDRLANIASQRSLKLVKEKILHEQARCYMAGEGIKKLPIWTKEVVSLRYMRYSGRGVLSALKDLIIN